VVRRVGPRIVRTGRVGGTRRRDRRGGTPGEAPGRCVPPRSLCTRNRQDLGRRRRGRRRCSHHDAWER
jgi:hypothetical protein